MPLIPRNLLLGLSLIALVAGGCKERQEPVPPQKPAVVRKKIEATRPPAVEPAKKKPYLSLQKGRRRLTSLSSPPLK